MCDSDNVECFQNNLTDGQQDDAGGKTDGGSSCSSNRLKRKKVLNEIYETEKTYQHNLMLLTTLFLEPVKVSSILPLKIIDGLFSNIEAIQSVSLHLLTLMEEHGVVHALLELAPYMKLYSVYANNFNTSAKLLEELQNRSADFKRLLKFQESREEMEGLKLNSLLLTPIQRVPRYRLLLENLLHRTQDNDPNCSKLKVAYEEIAKITAHINECVRQHENFNKMLAIQNSFTGVKVPQILQPGRLFVRQGVVSKMSSKGKAKECTLFLFNDMLVCAKKQSSEMYQCCDVYLLINCIVEQVFRSVDDENVLFKVICGDKCVLLYSKKENNLWVSDIKKAITELHENLASLKRGDVLGKSTSSYETVKIRNKTKVISPRNIFKMKPDSVSNSPLLNDISNLTPTKRNTIIEEPVASVFDIYRDACDLDLINSSTTCDMDNFINNNSIMTNNSSDDIDENADEYDEIFDESHNTSVDYLNSAINWTVTEKGGTIESENAIALLNERCCCIGKRKENVNQTGPYIKNKKRKLEKVDEFSSLYMEENSVQTLPSPEGSTLNDSSSSCLLM